MLNLARIKKDKFYSVLYDQYGEEFIKEAGYFENSCKEDIEIDDTLDIMCTPINFLKNNVIDENKKQCILLTTGSFAPIHNGHIDMLVKTKEYLEKKDWQVLGGYFAPDHDSYISEKLGNEAIPINYRIKYILEAIKEYSDWLTVDCWPGIFRNDDVNFTDIIVRLEKYIEKHLGLQISVIYVFGSDYQRFSKTFLNEGFCAIVNRPGFSFKVENINIFDNDRIFWIDNNNGESSTNVRKTNKFKKEKKKNLIIRTSFVKNDLNKQKLYNDLWHIIKEQFKEVEINFIEEQVRNLPNANIITLDPYSYKNDLIDLSNAHFDISRNYDYFGIKQLYYIERPGSLSFKEQLVKIGKVYDMSYANLFIHDDDIHTGGTMDYVKKLFEKEEIKVAGFISYTRSKEDEEIIDIRDFILDEENGGLVIDGKRYIYIYPFVDPFIRSSIYDNPIKFSIDIWKVNAEYYKNINKLNKYEFCIKNIKLLKKYI